MATYTGFTTTTSAVFLPTIWSNETLRATENALVAAGLVKRYDYLVKSRGQTITIPNISNAFTARQKTQGSDVTDDAVTEVATTININKWYYNSFIIEDLVSIQSNYDLRTEYSQKAGYSIAKQVDTDVMSNYSSWTNTAVGSYGIDIGDAVIVGAMEALNLADMPMEDRAFIIHPKQLSAIMKIDKFVKADYNGRYQDATPVKLGPNSRYVWGEIYGIRVYYTNNLPVTTATPNQTHNMLLHKEAIALALQQAPRLQAAYWLVSLGWRVIVDTVYGFTALRLTGGVEVRS
jgi:hypothetical protein